MELNVKPFNTIEVSVDTEELKMILGMLTLTLNRAEEVYQASQAALEIAKQLIAKVDTEYDTITEELKAQRELIDDHRQRIHSLGNMISGRLSATEAERFIVSVVNEKLKELGLNDISNR